MPILFDVFSRLPGAKHERVATVPAVPAMLSGTYDRIAGQLLRPYMPHIRDTLPYIHRKAFDRSPAFWTPPVSVVSAYGIYNTPVDLAFQRSNNGCMSLYDRRGRCIRDLRFHAYYQGPVTGSDGKPDGRYTYERENIGHDRPRYVTRFCGDFVAWSETLAGSHAHGWDHALARHAEMAE